MKVIGISGKAGHGKDETAKILKYKLESFGNKVLVIHYADYLKHLAKVIYNWNGEKDEYGRTLLQSLGQQAREINKNYWVDVVYNFICVFGNNYDYIIIPDNRHKNEIEYLIEKDLDVTTIRVNRIGYENWLTKEQRNHISETALDNYTFDIYLDVYGGIDYLEKLVDNVIENNNL